MIKSKILTPNEKYREEFYSQTTKVDDKGCYVVRLPLRQDVSESIGNPGDPYSKVVRILYRIKNRFDSDLEFAKLCKDFIRDHIERMTRIAVDSPRFVPLEKLYFILHHGMLKLSSLTTKLRTVFNGARIIQSYLVVHHLISWLFNPRRYFKIWTGRQCYVCIGRMEMTVSILKSIVVLPHV